MLSVMALVSFRSSAAILDLVPAEPILMAHQNYGNSEANKNE